MHYWETFLQDLLTEECLVLGLVDSLDSAISVSCLCSGEYVCSVVVAVAVWDGTDPSSPGNVWRDFPM